MSAHPDGYRVRVMTRADLDFALELAAAEGWNPGLADGDAFWAADPGGFLLGELEGRPVGCVSAVRYGRTFGFVGLYIVVPELRGQGLGIRLWNEAMRLLEGRNVGLDGVLAQQDNYRKSGFQWAFRSIRFQGPGPGPDTRENRGATPLDQADWDAVTAFDRTCFPEAREPFLRAWLTAPGTKALAWMDHGRLAGFGSVRPCREGFKIGPLFADNPEAAEGLFDSLCAAAGSGPVFLDVAETHEGAVALARARGMEPVFETARMYTRGLPDVDMDRVWGVTTFELG